MERETFYYNKFRRVFKMKIWKKVVAAMTAGIDVYKRQVLHHV